MQLWPPGALPWGHYGGLLQDSDIAKQSLPAKNLLYGGGGGGGGGGGR